MCLAIPGKIVSIDAEKHEATVDYEAEKRVASTMLQPDVKLGEYVLVQAKMVVEVIPEDEAKQALDAIRDAK